MELFVESQSLWSVINRDPSLLHVINRLGLRAGVGDYSIRESCEKHAIDENFFLSIINVFHFENYFPEQQLQAFPVVTVIDYLRKSHSFFIDEELAEIEQLLYCLVNSAKSELPEREMFFSFFNNYKKELVDHIAEEERHLFPSALCLYDAVEKGTDWNVSMFNHVVIKEDEHENIDNQVLDFKNILIKYMPREYDQAVCRKLVMELFRFEKDLVNHARIEEKILIPQMELMKKKIGLCSLD